MASSSSDRFARKSTKHIYVFFKKLHGLNRKKNNFMMSWSCFLNESVQHVEICPSTNLKNGVSIYATVEDGLTYKFNKQKNGLSGYWIAFKIYIPSEDYTRIKKYSAAQLGKENISYDFQSAIVGKSSLCSFLCCLPFACNNFFYPPRNESYTCSSAVADILLQSQSIRSAFKKCSDDFRIANYDKDYFRNCRPCHIYEILNAIRKDANCLKVEKIVFGMKRKHRPGSEKFKKNLKNIREYIEDRKVENDSLEFQEI